jgi:nicotinate-nucleotide--dimethylbenzimidazole phosphoribosyltransferase
VRCVVWFAMVWQRPVPLVGDISAASQRAADPAGWALPVEQREALHAVIAARRDVRRFRPDGVADEVMWRVLEAAHRAPSVGHSQPWRFVVVRDAALRERAALLADRERLRQAALMEPESARRLLDLQLEGIREAPFGVVVCCDRRTPAAGVLGRATFPDTDMWSCATAIQNLWLAARAEGLGLGWVTLFRPEELAELVGLPTGVATLGWLCLGWPDERPPDPGLERAGWSRRMPVADVVLFDRWPFDGAQPSPPPSHLRAPDSGAVVGARDSADRLLTPPGSLGVLDLAVNRVVALGRRELGAGVLVLCCADHPVTEHGVSAYPAGVTREVLAASAVGEAVGVTAARAAGLSTVLVDAGVDGPAVSGAMRVGAEGGRGDLVHTDAMSADDVRRLLAIGRDIGLRAGENGLVALGEVGVGNTTVAAALACALLTVEPPAAVGLGAGADSAILDRKRRVVSAALERATGEYGDGLADPVNALAALGGPEFAVLAGAVLGAVEAGAVVVLDGLATGVAALIALHLEPAVAAHLIAGQRSREPAHALVLTELGCEPLLDLRIRAGEGVAACLAVGLLRQALFVRERAARVAY